MDRMNPDIPVPSIEHEKVPEIPNGATMSTNNDKKGNTPRLSLSPDKSAYRTPLSHNSSPSPIKVSRSPTRALTPSHDRQKTPKLQNRRSSSNLTLMNSTTPQYRKTSSNLNPASPGAMSRPAIPYQEPPRPPMTASSVAKDYFKRELEQNSKIQSEVAVFVHDSCYGHRFSRPKTSKAALSTIVERPERIHATILGASTAYVRLGDRHAQGRHAPHPDRNVESISQIPFAIRKTSRFVPLNHSAVTHVHGTKWMDELQIMCDSAEAKLATNGKELVRPIGYGKDEAGNTLPKLHEGDLYLCSESLQALQGCLGGVCDAVDTVCGEDKTKRAFVCIRPPGHHCSSNYPSGFCWLNNVHVGISYAAMTHGLTHAAIIDFDLHHGDGSQTVTWDHNRDAQELPRNAPTHKKTPIGYYSLHDINSYPCEWGDEEKVRNASVCVQNAHGQSVWNVHLEPWTSLEHFWQLYGSKYVVLLEKARSFLRHHSERLRNSGVKPKAAIFLSAGFDASQWEGAGMQRHDVNVPTEFYARFTRDTVMLAEEAGLGVDGRVISVLEGGYSDRALTSGVLSHLCGLTGKEVHPNKNEEMLVEDELSAYIIPYDASWWNQTGLEALEAIVAGNPLPTPSVVREKSPGNYSSPTHASKLKMTDQARERRSLSAQLESRLIFENIIPEPVPDVDWVTASYELSRLLIPNDRQTLSCRHDELNAEATRVRRERLSATGLPETSEEARQLRDRKAKPIISTLEGVKASTRNASRRTTIAAVSDLPDPSMGNSVPEVRSRRRSSAGSSVLSSFQGMKLDDFHQEANIGGTKSGQASVIEGNSTPGKMKPPAIKKARAAPPRKVNSRASSPVKGKAEPALSEKVSASKLRLNTTSSRRTSSNTRSSPLTPSSSIEDAGGLDIMDDLTNGMKKVSIKLKLPTPEQHAANQKKTEEEKQSKPRAPRKPPVPRMVRTKPPAPVKPASQTQSATSNVPPILTPTQSISSEPSNNLPDTTILQKIADTQQVLTVQPPFKPSSGGPPTESSTKMSISNLLTDDPVEHTSAVKQSKEGENLMQLPQTIENTISNSTAIGDVPRHEQPVPPKSELGDSRISRTDMPPPPPAISSPNKKTKADLPVFTSSSPIPFQQPKPNEVEGSNTTKPEQQSSIWEIPETPKY